MPTDESMVDRSPIIVFGEVLSVQPGTGGESPTTEYLFAVEEVLKGVVTGSGIMVRQPGGLGVDGVAMRIGGLPMLAEGDRVLLFLQTGTNGAHSIVEYALGMFWEVDVGGQLLLLREPSFRAGEIRLPGDRQADEPTMERQPRDAASFRRWIADRAASVERPADYFETRIPPADLPVKVASSYRLLRCDDGVPLRWKEFDRNGSIGYLVHSGGQRGVPSGGLQQVRTGMRVWNDDARSRVDLRVERTTSDSLPSLEYDAVNSIMYEDPFDEIEGSLGDGGGTLAIAFTAYYRSCPAHGIPGGGNATEIVEADIVTQDGLGNFLSGRVASPTNFFERLITHELGHAIGIAHPCEPEEAGCNDSHGHWGALMWPTADRTDTSRARLHDDDRDAVRRLYPTETDSRAPDLVVESPRSTESSVAPSGAFRFAATVRNNGDERSVATTLRYYRSSDSRITVSDRPIGTDPVKALSTSGTDRQSIGQRAPSTPGTYYYGACVDSVSGETDTTNNCSSGVPISVAGATSSCSGATCLLQGERFRVKARYSKAGAPSRSAGAIEAALADSAGLFSGDSDSPELLVRIVNQCRTTGYWELYAGVASDADFSVAVRHVETNELKWFRTRDRQAIGDTAAFACTRSDDSTSPADPGDGTGDAACNGATCLLQEDRFRVKSWYARDGGSSQAADAISVDLGESTGLFAFDSGNPELLVRIADTCSNSGYWTVFAGAASDADFRVAIRDTETNELKWFRSRSGQSVADSEAFPCAETERVLAALVDFLDVEDADRRFSREDILDLLVRNDDSLSRFVGESSRNLVSLDIDVLDYVTVNKRRTDYRLGGGPVIEDAISAVSHAADLGRYDKVLLFISPLEQGYPGCAAYLQDLNWRTPNGVFELGVAWLSGYDMGCVKKGRIAHEFGHTFGFLHSYTIPCAKEPPIPASLIDPTDKNDSCLVHACVDDDCSETRPDDSGIVANSDWDMLGGDHDDRYEEYFPLHYQAVWQAQAGWLRDDQVTPVRSTGHYSLTTLESLDSAPKAMRVFLGVDHKGDPLYYWLQNRIFSPWTIDSFDQPATFDACQVDVRLQSSSVAGLEGRAHTYFFDGFGTDLSGGQRRRTRGESIIRRGRPFEDPYRGLRMQLQECVEAPGRTELEVSVEFTPLQLEPSIVALFNTEHSTATVTMTNGGAEAVLVDSVTIGGRHPESFTLQRDECGQGILAAGASCEIVVSQTGSTPADARGTSDHHAVLTVLSDDRLAPRLSLSLLRKSPE